MTDLKSVKYLFIFLVLLSGKMKAQDAGFDDTILSQLRSSPLPFEQGAEGTVLSDITNARIIYAGGFKIEYRRTVNIKILRPSGYYLANIQIPYGSKDKITNIRATVYNLTDSLPEQSDIPGKSMFHEKVDLYHNMIRFTFPNVREGSVIHYSYTIVQNEVWNYHSTRFQRQIPVRFVKYVFSHPGYLDYVIHYNQDSLIQFSTRTKKGYFGGNMVNFIEYSWTGYNLDIFEKEPLMPESDQYILGVDFALVSIHMSDGVSFMESPGYQSLTEELIRHNSVGQQIDNAILFNSQVRKINVQIKDRKQKLAAIYAFVQKEMKWNGYEQMWPSRSLTKARKNKTGTNAEINLILINMLRRAGIQADPVILSTRENGPVNQIVATTGRLNYLVACAVIDGQDYLLDASDKFNPPGTLPFKCLNGNGWLLNPRTGRWIPLHSTEAFSISEAYDLVINSNKVLTGKAVVKFYGYEASNLRRLISEEGISGFLNKVASIDKIETVSDIRFVNLDSLQLPLEVNFNITLNHYIENAQDLAFFSPVLNLFGTHTNSLIGEKRLFPVDLGCRLSNAYYCRIKVPDGFHIEEVPPDLMVRMPENNGTFTYSTGVMGNSIVTVCDLKVIKSYFNTDEYASLKEFFTQADKKYRELAIIHKNAGIEP